MIKTFFSLLGFAFLTQQMSAQCGLTILVDHSKYY